MLYIGTNLKMYKTIAQTVDYMKELQDLTSDIDRERLMLFVIPSYTSLESAGKCIINKNIKFGAQNMFWEPEGQFTGEISPVMLKETGVEIIEIGHSERRHVFGETDADVNKKVLAALKYSFTVLLCIGETKEQKELGIGNEILNIQLKTALCGVSRQDLNRLWIAYEPVWAIGVHGTPASSEYVSKKHQVIKSVLKALYGETGESVPVLYGGSVNNENAHELIIMPGVDGLFIGRSAWNAVNFNKIIRQVIELTGQCKKRTNSF